MKEVLLVLGKKMETPSRNWSPTRERLIQAGFRKPLALLVFLGGRLAAAGILYFYFVFVSLALVAPGLGAMLLGVLGAAFGWVVPSFFLSVRVTKRQRAIQKLLPDAVDLLVICVEAGMGLNQARGQTWVSRRDTRRDADGRAVYPYSMRDLTCTEP